MMVRPGRALSLTLLSLVEMRVKVDGMREPRRWEVRPSSIGRGRVVESLRLSCGLVNNGMDIGKGESTHGQGPPSLRMSLDICTEG